MHGRLPSDGYSSLFTQPGADRALAVGERGSYAIAWRAGEIDARPVASLSGHPVVSMDRRAVVHVARDGDDVLLRGADGRLERLRSGAWLGGSPVVSPDGRFIAAPRKRAVSVWTVGGERDPLVIDVHGRVTAIAWHPASDRLAIATLDSVRMVDLSATRLIASGCELLAHLGESRLSQRARLRHVPDGVRYADPCDNE